VEEHRSQYPVNLMCRLLEVSTSTYYGWRRRESPTAREQRRQELTFQIRLAHRESHGIYGSPRIHAVLQLRGIPCSKNTVETLMRKAGIRAKTARKYRCTTDSNHSLPVAENLVQREFLPEAPNLIWAGDITEIVTREGRLYLAVILDLYSRLVVGWSVRTTMETQLVVNAFRMASRRRRITRELIFHSDQGSQYASWWFHDVLITKDIRPSMSKKGDCYDNAVVESFFGKLKGELFGDTIPETRIQASNMLLCYIEAFYNRQRLHSTIGNMSPQQYERMTGLSGQ